MVKNNKNSVKAPSKRARRQRTRNRVVNGVLGLPSRYPAVPGDSTRIRTRFSFVTTAPGTGPYNDAGLIILGRGTNAAGYTFLSTLSAAFGALTDAYQRFMVTDLSVEARAIGGTTNALGSVSYVPSDSTTHSPPNTLAEASQAVHVAQFTWGAPGKFQVAPMEYYGDWRNCFDADDGDKQAGFIQYFVSGSAANSVMSIFDVEMTIVLAGLAY